MFPNLKIISSVYGKFGTVIEGTFNKTYFKAICEDFQNETICKKIESTYDATQIGEALVWCGYVNTYEVPNGNILRTQWFVEIDCSNCGSPLTTDGRAVWCTGDDCGFNDQPLGENK
jgi:hypothetical protein